MPYYSNSLYMHVPRAIEEHINNDDRNVKSVMHKIQQIMNTGTRDYHQSLSSS